MGLGLPSKKREITWQQKQSAIKMQFRAVAEYFQAQWLYKQLGIPLKMFDEAKTMHKRIRS